MSGEEHYQEAARLLGLANEIETDIRAVETLGRQSRSERMESAERNQMGFRLEALIHAVLHLASKLK